MQILASVIVAFLILLPFTFLLGKIVSSDTVILEGATQLSPLFAGMISLIVFGVIGYALRRQLKQFPILQACFLCAALIYTTEFGSQLYDGLMENFLFMKPSRLYTSNVEFVGTEAGLTRGGGAIYSGFVRSFRGSNLSSKVYVTSRLFKLLHGERDVRLYTALPANSCFLRAMVQDTGEAKRIVYSAPFDTIDMVNCPRARD